MSRSSIEASPGSEPVGITPAAGSGRAALAQNFLRRIPIRWRILLIAIANTAVVLILAVLIAQSARIVNNTWTDLVRVRASFPSKVPPNDPKVRAARLDEGLAILTREHGVRLVDPLDGTARAVLDSEAVAVSETDDAIA